MARKFMKGTEAIAEAAVRSGCRFFAGYPITPQNEIPEYLARRLPEVGGAFVQGESEVASINMVYGSAGTGTRAMTSSSSCGISLMSEGHQLLRERASADGLCQRPARRPRHWHHPARPAGLYAGHEGQRQRRLSDDGVLPRRRCRRRST